jgi:hypothetical protein
MSASMEAAMMESEFMMDPEMLDPEEMMGMIGENVKLENIQKMLKESMVDSDFYNSMYTYTSVVVVSLT